jgi:hypothetical protein
MNCINRSPAGDNGLCSWLGCENPWTVDLEWTKLCSTHESELNKAIDSMSPPRVRTAIVRAVGENPLLVSISDIVKASK